jgi:outer membrane protein, multidrug efflux system
MNTIKKQLFKQVLVLACVGSFLPSCATAVNPKVVELDVPKHFQNQAEDLANSSQVQWKDFFDDPKLNQLIDAGLENNKEIRIVMQKIEMANNEVFSRQGEYLPFLSIKSTADLEKVGKYTRNGAVESNTEITPGQEFPEPLPNFMLGVFASWELDVWKKLRNAKDAAVFEYMATMEGKKFLVTNLVAEIADAYYELMALDNKLKNMQTNIKIQENVLRIIKLLKQAAKANELAVKRFEAEVKKNQSKIYTIRQAIVETENKLNYLIGRRPQAIPRNSEVFVDLKPKVVDSGVPSQLLDNRPDILRAEEELAAANLNIEVAKAKFYPSFGMNAGLGYQAFNPLYLINTPQSLTYSLSVDMAMPIVNRNAIEAEYKNANAKQIQAAYEYEKTILNAYREVANQLANIQNLEKNYQMKNEQVKALTESITISGMLFQSARADYMEVLLTQRDALEAKMEQIETKKAQLSAMVNLYKALGGGWK